MLPRLPESFSDALRCSASSLTCFVLLGEASVFHSNRMHVVYDALGGAIIELSRSSDVAELMAETGRRPHVCMSQLDVIVMTRAFGRVTAVNDISGARFHEANLAQTVTSLNSSKQCSFQVICRRQRWSWRKLQQGATTAKKYSRINPNAKNMRRKPATHGNLATSAQGAQQHSRRKSRGRSIWRKQAIQRLLPPHQLLCQGPLLRTLPSLSRTSAMAFRLTVGLLFQKSVASGARR